MNALAIVPTFKYADAFAAIAFLCEAFGFEKHAVFADGHGGVAHAQLKLGANFVMLGSAGAEGSYPSKTPGELGGATGGVYVVLERNEDVDVHYARARAAGAAIVMELYTPEYGGRNYTATDSEGYLWSFGSYRPESA